MSGWSKAVSVLLVIILSAALFVSCDTEMKDQTVQLSILAPLSDGKSLTVTDNAAITEYRYNAEALFSDQYTGRLTGVTNGFVRLGTDASSPLPIGAVSQGRWRFSVQGLNSNGVVIATGSVELYVNSEMESDVVTVPIVTSRSIGTGNVSLTVSSDATSASKMGMLVRYKATDASSYTERTTWNTAYSAPKSEVTLTGTVTGLASGHYEFHIILTDNGTYLGGESHSVQVVAGETTVITGTVLPAKQLAEGLDISSPGFINGTLGDDRQIHKGDTATVTWSNVSNATVTPDSYVWMVDGEFKSGSSQSYSFSGTDYGEHQISVIALKKISGVEREIGSATVTVSVVRRLADITFNADGGLFANGQGSTLISQDTYEDPKVPDIPQRSGYVFSGWYDGTTRVVSAANVIDTARFRYEGAKTLKASWTKVDYTATVVWGENVKVGSTAKPQESTHAVTYGDALSFLSTPTRDGYSFGGFWTESNGRGTQVNSSTRYTWTENATFYAKWSFNNITVSFVKESGQSAYKTKGVAKDLPYGSLPSPIKQGYVFGGWWTSATGGTQVTADTIVTGSANHTLYAHWEEGNITVTLDVAGGSLASGTPASGKVALGSTYGSTSDTPKGVIPSSDPTKSGYTFKGWYWEERDLRILPASIVATDQNHTLKARWQGNDYTVSFNSNGGSSCAAITVRYGNPYGTLPTPTKVGYRFEGWKYSSTTVTSETTANLVAGNHTLTAQWSAATYTLTLNMNPQPDGVAPQTKTITYGSTYGAGGSLPSPTRTGYTFNGWYTSTSGGTRITDSTTVTTTVSQTLYAQWTAKQANLIMYRNYNGSDNTTVNASGRKVTYGSALGSLQDLERTGYTFSGWYTARDGGTKVLASTIYETDSTADYSIYAHWSIRNISITLDPAGGSLTGTSPVQRNYGTSYGSLGQASKTGYDFAGWYYESTQISGSSGNSAVTMNRENDHTLSAHYSAHTMTVSFDSHGGSACTSRTVPYGSTYGASSDLPTPAKDGFTFLGWYMTYSDGVYSDEVQNSTAVTTDGNHTLHAKWSAKPVAVLFDWGTGNLGVTLEYGQPYGTLPAPTLSSGQGIEGWYLNKSGSTYTNPIESTTLVTTASAHTVYAKVVSMTYHYHIDEGSATRCWSYDELTSRFSTGYTAVSGSLAGFANVVSVREVSTGGVLTVKSGSTNTSWTSNPFPQSLTFSATAEKVNWRGTFTCSTCGGTGSVTETCPTCNGTGYYNEYVTCDECGGSGSVQTTKYDECPTCSGAGQTVCRQCNGTGRDYSLGGAACMVCDATGVVTCSNCGGDGWKVSYESVDCDECGGDGTIYVCSTCPKTVTHSCPTTETRETETEGRVVVTVAGTQRINTTSSSTASNISVPASSSISVSFTAASAPSGYPTRVSQTRAPSYSVKDNGYGNYRFVLINSSGEYLSLDSYQTSGIAGTRYHDKTVNLGSVSNSSLTGYYFFPGYIYRDSYANGVLVASDEKVYSGGSSGTGSATMVDASGTSTTENSATSISWSSSGLYVTGSGILTWNTSEPVRSFSLSDFH